MRASQLGLNMMMKVKRKLVYDIFECNVTVKIIK